MAKRLGKSALARALTITRPNLDGYLNRKDPLPPQPDEKRAYDVDEVSAYISKVRETEQSNQTLTQLRAEKLKHELGEVRKAAARRDGEFIARDDAKRTIESTMTELGSLLREKFEDELPSRYVGKSAVECSLLNAAAIDTIVLRFKQGMRGIAA